MRHTQFRVHAEEASGGMVSVSLTKVFYDGARIAGHEIVLMDWCEPGELEVIANQFLSEVAGAAQYAAAELQAPHAL